MPPTRLIGPFRRYDKHPIFDLYNLGLTENSRKLVECPQILVCTNMDDQGIFSTYLENGYALLALSLEEAKDETGKYQYNRMLIYQWIDQVRQLGINLSSQPPFRFRRLRSLFLEFTLINHKCPFFLLLVNVELPFCLISVLWSVGLNRICTDFIMFSTPRILHWTESGLGSG